MSTNPKNLFRPEYFKNHTKKIKHREILVENGKVLNGKIQEIANEVNSKVNQIIQKLNLNISTRQLPYITLDIKFNTEIDRRSRMVLIERDTEEGFEENIRKNTRAIGHDVSHFIEILTADGYQEVVISPLGCNAEIVISKEYFIYAIIDILLDISMFNSYSFLKNMTVIQKHDFCQQKYNFFKSHDLTCFYDYRGDKDLYYSFAFTARTDIDCFDVDTYIDLWNSFIKEHFSGFNHTEKTVQQQLKQHVDYEELPRNLLSKFKNMPSGAYIILRTNKDVTEGLHPSIYSVFGCKKYRKGLVKIIPMEDFGSYEFLCKNLDVSVFKIVK